MSNGRPSLDQLKWLYPGMQIKRWLLVACAGLLLFGLGIILLVQPKHLIDLELWLAQSLTAWTHLPVTTLVVDYSILFLGLALMVLGIKKWFASIYSALIPYEQKKLVEVVYEQRQLGHGLKIVCVGGGTGLSSVLRGLKKFTSNLVAVVTVSDDGGSSGLLRKELGVLPPGDIRNCLVALANDESLLSSLFQYRFAVGDGVGGHSFGNLFLAAVTGIAGNFDLAVKLSSKILAIQGKVFPATLATTVLCAELADGTVVEGESAIPRASQPIRRVFLKPGACEPLPEVLKAIKEADAIVLGPGSLYTSILPNLLVPGMVEAIRQSKAMKIYVCNVMTQPGETAGFSASAHVNALSHHVGGGLIDYCIINDQGPTKLLDKYRAEGAAPVLADVEEIERLGIRSVCARLISETNLVRHDPALLANVLVQLILEAGDRAAREPSR